MRQRLISLLLEQPFERIAEILAQEDITIKYSSQRGDYYCHYWVKETETETANQKNIKLAAAYGIISKLEEDVENGPTE